MDKSRLILRRKLIAREELKGIPIVGQPVSIKPQGMTNQESNRLRARGSGADIEGFIIMARRVEPRETAYCEHGPFIVNGDNTITYSTAEGPVTRVPFLNEVALLTSPNIVPRRQVLATGMLRRMPSGHIELLWGDTQPDAIRSEGFNIRMNDNSWRLARSAL